MEIGLPTPKNSKVIELRKNLKSKSLSTSLNQFESFLFKLLNNNILEFLTLKDFAFGILFLNTKFYFIFDEQPHILYYLAKKYYLDKKSPNFSVGKFFKKQLQKLNITHELSTYKELHNTICMKIQLNKNMIKNHSGKEKFEHWQIQKSSIAGWFVDNSWTQFPNKTCFVASNGMNAMCQIINFNDFSFDVRELLKSGKALIKAGCYIARTCDNQIEGYFEVRIYKDRKLLFHESICSINDFLPCASSKVFYYVLMSTTYNINPKELPDIIEVRITGVDLRSWIPFCGPRFSNVFVICDLKKDESCQ